MSAPHEVWVSQKMTFIPMGKKMRVWYAYDDRGDNTVIKYLRADLTCGECIFSDNTATWCIGRGLQVQRDAPACMAFKEKK